MCVGDIAARINASLQNTSQHLRLMKDKGILASRREGHVVYYSIVEGKLLQSCQALQCGELGTTHHCSAKQSRSAFDGS